MNNPGTGDQTQYQPGRASHPLSRPQHGRMLAGVAAGLADYLGVDATLVRIAFVLLTFVGGAGPQAAGPAPGGKAGVFPHAPIIPPTRPARHPGDP